MSYKEKRANRLRFLERLYEELGGSTSRIVNMWELGATLNFDQETADDVVDYLIQEGLVEPRGIGGTITISHSGIKEIENAKLNPTESTHYFPPINIIQVKNMNNSAIQQGTSDSTQVVDFTTDDKDVLNKLITELESIKSRLPKGAETYDEFVSELDTLVAQRNSPRPKLVIIKEGIKSIRAILEGVSAGLITSGLLSMMEHFIA